MKLYDYFRSTACYRVRIALEHKNIPYEKIPVHLVTNGGEQHSAEYQKINAQKLVPSLEVNGHVLHQSLAIIEYLDEAYPQNPLLPKDPIDKSKIRALALMIACDTHPLNNLRVLNYLKSNLSSDEQAVTQWYHHWLRACFDAFEAELRTLQRSKPVCFGDGISLADLCLIPQVYNAKRYHFSMDAYPLINEINAYCVNQPCFVKAAPEEPH